MSLVVNPEAIVISLNDAKQKLYAHRRDESTMFTVIFVKRTTGEVREMLCRFNVKKYLVGGERPYVAKDYDLIGVWDVTQMQYKCIPLDALMYLRIGGEEFQISDNIHLITKHMIAS